MSEITHIEIIKDDPQHVSVVVRAVRDDSLPNSDLIEPQDIATTGFVLFCNTVFFNYDKREWLTALYQDLVKVCGNEHFYDKYFKPETTNQFIESAKVVEIRTNHDEFYIDDWMQQFGLTQDQRIQLYETLNIEEEGEELEENFGISLFLGNNTDEIVQVIGQKRFRSIQPIIHIQMKFKNPQYIEKLYDLDAGSSLDSHIVSWLPKENRKI